MFEFSLTLSSEFAQAQKIHISTDGFLVTTDTLA